MRCRSAAAPLVGNLYEAPRVKRAFRDQHFFFFPSVSRCSRERNSALMARQSLCLAELSGQPPEPGGSRPPWREGLTAKARAKPQWPRAITQTNVTAFYVAVDPLSALK